MRISDWSSDVCSSDLGRRRCAWPQCRDRSLAGVLAIMSHVTPVQVQRSVLKEKTSREKAMEQAVQWIAPVTTSIAAVMVALNGGARLTDRKSTRLNSSH